MQQQIKESAKQKKKRNKSQEHTGAMDPDAANAAGKKSEGGVNSYGSIEALVDEEEDAQRLREVQEVEQNYLNLTNQKDKAIKGGDKQNKRFFVAQK